MHYLQRDHASGTGYEYATSEPRIASGDVSTTWGPRQQAHGFADEAEAAKWAHLLGCYVTRFVAEAPPVVAPVDPAEARRQRVRAHLAEEQRKADEAKAAAKAPK